MSTGSASITGIAAGERAARIYSPAGGGMRDVIVHVPAPVQLAGAGRWPLIIALHDKTQRPEALATQSGLSDPEVNKEYIVAYPSGLSHQWTGDPAAPPRSQVNDIMFIDDLMMWMLQNYPVDPGRIFLVGLSNGGGLAALAACHPRLSQAICAVALASVSVFLDEALEEPIFSKFEATRFPLPLIEFHGDADPVVDYNGVDTIDGPSWPLGDWLRRYTWMNERGLSGQILAEEAEEETLFDGRVEKFVWRCGTEHEIVVHYIIHGFGHGWPTQRAFEEEGNRHGPAPFDATPIIFDFFKSSASLERRLFSG